MKVLFYLAIATKEKEDYLIGASINRRMLEIQRDAFMIGHVEYNSKIYPITIEIEPDREPRIVLDDEQQPELGGGVTSAKVEDESPKEDKVPVIDVDDILGNKEAKE